LIHVFSQVGCAEIDMPERSAEAGQLVVTGMVEKMNVSRALEAPSSSSQQHVVELGIDGSVKADSQSAETNRPGRKRQGPDRCSTVQINRDA
jgi:hypothetical protein